MRSSLVSEKLLGWIMAFFLCSSVLLWLADICWWEGGVGRGERGSGASRWKKCWCVRHLQSLLSRAPKKMKNSTGWLLKKEKFKRLSILLRLATKPSDIILCRIVGKIEINLAIWYTKIKSKTEHKWVVVKRVTMLKQRMERETAVIKRQFWLWYRRGGIYQRAAYCRMKRQGWLGAAKTYDGMTVWHAIWLWWPSLC